MKKIQLGTVIDDKGEPDTPVYISLEDEFCHIEWENRDNIFISISTRELAILVKHAISEGIVLLEGSE